jgi:hypothetical protein
MTSERQSAELTASPRWYATAAFWRRYLLLVVMFGLAFITGNPLFLLLFGGPALVSFFWDRSAQALASWCIYAGTFVAFVLLRMYADDYGPEATWRYAATLDTWLGGGQLPTIALQRAFYEPGAPRWWDWLGVAVYQTHYFCTPVVGVLVWRFRPALLRRYLLAISLAYWIGLVIHWLLPTIPPWLASLNGGLPESYRPLWHILEGVTPEMYRAGVEALDRNTVAAMPSMHTAAAAMVACVAWSGPRWVRALGVLYPILMLLALVYFAEHYVVDGIVGAGLVMALWKWLGRKERKQAA